MTKNEKAFLDTIAWSEIGPELLAVSDNGYNILVGSTHSHPLLFTDYSHHPNILNSKMHSTAAGRYQILHRYAVAYTKSLHLPDFGHDSQDKIALQMMKECHAGELLDDGNIVAAIIRCGSRWASFPGNTYQQHTNDIKDLVLVYKNAGGSTNSKHMR